MYWRACSSEVRPAVFHVVLAFTIKLFTQFFIGYYLEETVISFLYFVALNMISETFHSYNLTCVKILFIKNEFVLCFCRNRFSSLRDGC